MSSPLYLKNGILIDQTTLEFTNGDFIVEKGPEGNVRPADSIPPGSEILDCKGKYVTRSFVNSHHHIYSALAVGMPAPFIQPQNFYEILENIWWKLDKSLTEEMVEVSALVTAAASIRSGVSFIIDHHSSPSAAKGSLATIKRSLQEAGISSSLCYELSDRDGENAVREALEETESFLNSGSEGLVGLHASFTVSDNLLKKAVSLADKFGKGIHIHAAEDQVDQDITIKKYGKRVIERLSDSGVLSLRGSLLAHCINIDKNERNLISNSDAWVVQNPDSNMNNGVGIYNPEKLETISLLGTDGMNSDMMGSLRSAWLAGNLSGGNSPEHIYRRLRNSHKYLENIGASGDGENNLIVLDYKPTTEMNKNNFHGHLLYCMSRCNIDSLISKGNIIMREKELLTIDEASIIKRSNELGKDLWARMKEI